MKKVKVGDFVQVLAGKDKGKQGKVIRVMRKLDKVLIENVNLAKKHVKGNPRTNTQGSIQDKEMPIHISNVLLVNPSTSKPSRIGFKSLEDGKKVRYFKDNGEMVDVIA